MSTPKQASSWPKKPSKWSEEHSVAGAIKEAMARRQVGLRDLSGATDIPYRTLQNYLLGTTSGIPVPAIAKIAEALDVSADWLILGREPNIDKETLMIVLEYFDDVIRPRISDPNMEAAADQFLHFYQQVYTHHYSLPGVQLTYKGGGRMKGERRAGRAKSGGE